MANRTIRVQGWGVGTASITAVLDGETVFSGNVDLVEFSNENSSMQAAPTLFSFELPIDFDGTKQMKITVGKAIVRFGMIVGNYAEIDGIETFDADEDIFWDISPTGPQGVKDPRSDVRIDGILQPVDRQGRTGTWHWEIMPGSVFEHTMSVKPGISKA